ncbi:CYTH and CHAD domain-containing protein [Polaromonas sp.]|uniref:CYTH and CHAD domain-containing protein n=1 Tax=Polaromonas sp. TaxID=1869339 RepID=UPI001D5DC236|nr:CYTH and CHAD domain-containing protein [Polaromonas sp.]MBT9476354.1 CHAD domain-containing protein [Polaromonas sp.]
MKNPPPPQQPEEIELKLALPTRAPTALAEQLARTPLLARRKPTQLPLHNIYFDTPGQLLHQARVALRLRRVGSEASPQWLQTLKMGGRSDSALSQRGEWEAPVPGPALSWQALQATPWSGLDPDGSVFKALAPCFATDFERTRWTVRKRDHSVVEVALDIGHVGLGEQRTPICELELELLAGPPGALFDVARQIARSVAVLPANTSKAERGYALALGTLALPRRAQPPALAPGMALSDAAQCVLREMFAQFTTNLDTLRSSDDPEVVHQARVGWRRFRSALRLFRPALAAHPLPSWQALKPLLSFMGALRDLDVARTDTLPPLAEAYAAGDASRAAKWQALDQALAQAAALQRKSVRYALEAPALGSALLATTEWLETLPGANVPAVKGRQKTQLRRWARRRITRLHAQLERALKDASNPDRQHRARILAKRLRYGVEALRPLLPRGQAKRWTQQATTLQTGLGASRDMVQAGVLAASLDADRALVEFLRGVAVGQQRDTLLPAANAR